MLLIEREVIACHFDHKTETNNGLLIKIHWKKKKKRRVNMNKAQLENNFKCNQEHPDSELNATTST